VRDSGKSSRPPAAVASHEASSKLSASSAICSGWGVRTPILILTERDSEEDTIRGLISARTTILVKPFALGELLARVRARRSRSARLQGCSPRSAPRGSLPPTRSGPLNRRRRSERNQRQGSVAARARGCAVETVGDPGQDVRCCVMSGFEVPVRHRVHGQRSVGVRVRALGGPRATAGLSDGTTAFQLLPCRELGPRHVSRPAGPCGEPASALVLSEVLDVSRQHVVVLLERRLLSRETPNRPDDEREKEEDAEHNFDEAGHRSNVRAVSVSRYDLGRSASSGPLPRDAARSHSPTSAR
jgi:hypothetical protein